jgi:hypothetical protein
MCMLVCVGVVFVRACVCVEGCRVRVCVCARMGVRVRCRK